MSPQLTSAVRFDIVWDKMLGTQSIHAKRLEVQCVPKFFAAFCSGFAMILWTLCTSAKVGSGFLPKV